MAAIYSLYSVALAYRVGGRDHKQGGTGRQLQRSCAPVQVPTRTHIVHVEGTIDTHTKLLKSRQHLLEVVRECSPVCFNCLARNCRGRRW